MNQLTRKYSHSWQWPVVVVSFFAGIAHIAGAFLDDFDPSIATGDLPTWVNLVVGALLAAGSALMALSRCDVDALKALADEQLGLGLLWLAWLAQAVVTMIVLFDQPIPWMAYLAISAECAKRWRGVPGDRAATVVATSDKPTG